MGNQRVVDADGLLKACRRLGDAAINPALWPELIEDVGASVGATGAVLFKGDARTPDALCTPSIREMVDDYFRNGFHLADIRAARSVPMMLRGAPVTVDHDCVEPDEMRRDPLYAMLNSHGLQWFSGVGLWAGGALWALCFQRTTAEGPFEEADKRTLALLSPRLTEVATLSTAIGRIAITSATDALTLVNRAAVAVDRMGSVVAANPLAEALFDDEMWVKNGRLYLVDEQARRALQTLLDRMRRVSDLDPMTVAPFVVRRRRKAALIVRVLPVHGAARGPFFGARVLLTLSPIEKRPSPDPALLVRAFGLTPAEARLAAMIAGGRSPEQAADALGVTESTARNQLKSVFAKTGAHRQGELVALLAGL
jgi:DNA-binding CsgD family transcriptional regulator